MHSAVLKEVKYHETMSTKAEKVIDLNIYITLVQNSKWNTSSAE